jgi:exodeoxyribonuclease VII large subunit
MAKKDQQQLMMDLLGGGSGEEKIFTVSQFLDFINELISFEGMSVKGEISSWKPHPTGIYFSLKDKSDGAVMDCYMSPPTFRGLGIFVEEGMEVKLKGIPSIYKSKGRFSFRADSLELMGEGSLKKAYEMLKQKLEAEGLFHRKRELPEFITRVGVITSRTGAVIDDFRKNLSKLGIEVILYDVRVEGAQAVNNILSGIEYFNKNHSDLDVLAIMRGGGSLEDMQAFNNELVVRAVFASKIPTICAIGHDRDVPIVAMVGDVATSTPTAAAVRVNASWDRLYIGLPQMQQDLIYNFERILDEKKNLLSIDNILNTFQRILSDRMSKIENYSRYLVSVSPERNLKLGYSILKDGDGKVLKSAKKLKKGEEISAFLVDGEVISKVEKINLN